MPEESLGQLIEGAQGESQDAGASPDAQAEETSSTADAAPSEGGGSASTQAPPQTQAGAEPETKTSTEAHGLRQALLEERRQRQAYEQYILQMQQKNKELEGKETPPPSFEEDPTGHLKAQSEAAQKKIQEYEQHLAYLHHQQQQQQVQNQVIQQVNSSEQQFAKKHDDYYEAIGFLAELEAAKLQALGIPDDQVHALVRQGFLNTAQGAIQQGRNPAEIAYKIAGVYGWDSYKKLAAVQKGTLQAKGVDSSGQAPAGGADAPEENSFGDLISSVQKEQFGRR